MSAQAAGGREHRFFREGQTPPGKWIPMLRRAWYARWSSFLPPMTWSFQSLLRWGTAVPGFVPLTEGSGWAMKALS